MSPPPSLGHPALWELATKGTRSNQLGDCILFLLDNICYSFLVIQKIHTICIIYLNILHKEYWWGGTG